MSDRAMECNCVPKAVSEEQVLLSFIKKIWFRPAKKAGSLNKASCQLQHTLKNNSTENNWDKRYLFKLSSKTQWAFVQFLHLCMQSIFRGMLHEPLSDTPVSLPNPHPRPAFTPFTTFLSWLRVSEISWHTLLHYDASKEDGGFVFFGPLPCFV